MFVVGRASITHPCMNYVAQKMANFKNTILNVGDGLSSALGGYGEAVSGGKIKADNNSAFFQDGIDQNNKKVAGVKAGANSKIEDLLKKDTIERTDIERRQKDFTFADNKARSEIERGQKDKDFAHKEKQRDPNSPAAIAAKRCEAWT